MYFGIAEKPQEYGPLLININLELAKTDYIKGTRLYNDDMILDVINAYREAANKYLKLSSTDLQASIFQKRKPTKQENAIKDGFHVIFPGIIANCKIRYIIRDDVEKKLKQSETFTGFRYSIEKIIDKTIINANGWLLPGSKTPNGYLYELTEIYNKNNNKLNVTKLLENKSELVNMYSLQDEIYSEDNKTDYNDDITFSYIEEKFRNLGKK